MQPKIVLLQSKKLIGKRMRMALSENRTYALWHSFMKQRKEIQNQIGKDLFSIQIYDKALNMTDFNQDTFFEKWAATAVSCFDFVPNDMEIIKLPAGLYAVFVHKGDSTTFPKTMDFIFKEWLPESEYAFEYRPQFEVLGEKYKNNDPDSEEEVWIPIKRKG